jgi:hypothetical protein
MATAKTGWLRQLCCKESLQRRDSIAAALAGVGIGVLFNNDFGGS